MYQSPTSQTADRPTSARRDRELNHRIANSLQLAVDFLGFQQQRTGDPAARRALEETMARLAAVGQLHRYLAGVGEAGAVELAGFLRGLCGLIARSTALNCELRAEAVRIPAATAQQVGLLVNECAINAAKHAYRAPGGLLRVTASVLPGRLKLVVSDAGPGLAAETSEGLGLGIIAAIVRQLGGAMAAESREGARFTFLIPLPAGGEARSFADYGEA